MTPETWSKRLRPCPFCGGSAKLKDWRVMTDPKKGRYARGFFVYHACKWPDGVGRIDASEECFTLIETAPLESPADAVNAWNRRA